ncbi:MAG: DUF6677 family protein [Candidatus Acidiferrales bacterium]
MSETFENPPQRSVARTRAIAACAVVAAWIVPGLGHLLLGRRGRALAFFLVVGGLAVVGYFLRGNVFEMRDGAGFGFLGYLADLGSGIFYFLAHSIEKNGPNVARAAGDYGTRFIATAGIVNILCAFDAYEIASGLKK